MSSSVLFSTAEDLVTRDNFAEAVPFLEEIVNRFVEDENARERVESSLFFLALGYIQAGQLSNAETRLEQYSELFPQGDNIHRALNFLGDVQRAQGNFEKAAETYEKASRLPRFRTDIQFRRDILERLTQTLVVLQEWERGVPVFRSFYRDAVDPERRAFAASALLQAFVRLERFNDAFELLPSLVVESPARYDINFNVSMMLGGDAIFEQGDPVRASVFYSLTLDPGQIREYFTNRRDRLQIQLERGEAFNLAPDRLSRLQNDIFNAEAQLEALDELEDFSLGLRWRQARVFAQLERDFEAYWAFLRLYEENQDSPQAENFLFAAFAQAVRSGMEQEALELGDRYNNNPRFTQFRDSVSVQLAQLYLNIENYPRFEELALEFIRNRPEAAGAFQLVFMLGSTLSEQRRYQDLIDLFTMLEDEVSSDLVNDGFAYWRGMAHLFLNNFPAVFQEMDRFYEGFQFSPYREDAIFRRAISLFGQGKISEAEEAFINFLQRFQNSNVAAEAEVFLGDIAAADGRLEEALERYRRVGEISTNIVFIDHAFFQAARLLERNRQHEEKIEWMEEYIQRWPDEGIITDALFQISRALTALGRPEEGLDRSFEAIQRFGNDPFTFGIDRMLETYPAAFRRIHGHYPIEQFTDLYREAERRGNLTLQFRMEWALNLIGVDIADFRVLSREDLLASSPRTLLYFGEMNLQDDPDTAVEAFDMLLRRFGSSAFVPQAEFALGMIDFDNERLDEAMERFQRIERRFPTSEKAAFAALRIADIYLAQGDISEAERRYQNILRTREFRGPVWAEAQFKVGLIHYNQGRYREAHGFFQRVYIAFEGFTEWSSQAYLMSASALEALGKTAEARETLQELVNREERFQETPAFAEARRRLGSS